MPIQKRKEVLDRTKHSWAVIYDGCSNLMEELEAKEIEAYNEERYFEAFIIQFSFIEWQIETVTLYFAKKLNLHHSSLKSIEDETSVNRKISNFDLILSSFIKDESKTLLLELVDKLREYNTFRNDLLHNCGNPNKFDGALHIDQSLTEAYDEGQTIIKLLSKLKLRK
jgi:hypothetical protein